MEKSSREINIKTVVNGLDVPSDQSLVPAILLGDRVLIDPIEPEKMLSESANIAKPINMKEDYRKGTIVSIGRGEYGTSIPEILKPGLVVNYYHQQELEFTVAGHTYKLVRASDIFAFL